MSKKFKTIISVLLALIIVSSVPVYAMTATTKVNCSVPLLQEGNYDIPKFDVMSLSAVDPNLVELKNEIYNQLLNCTAEISVDTFKYQYTADEFRDIYCDIINDNPDLFFVTSSFSLSISNLTKYVVAIRPIYSMKPSEVEQAKIIFNDGVNKALSVVDDSMDEMQKALVLHDYICDVANYERAGDISHSAYGFFKDGNVVCAGYSLAYSYLLNKAGVRCEYMASSPMQHAWNAIMINGNWYHCDLTYDDIYCYNQHENIRGAMKHCFFLKSDDYFKSVKGGCHFGFNSYDVGIASDTSLDSYFWDDIDTYIPVIDGSYYYIDIEPSKHMYLKKRDTNGNETYVNKDVAFTSAAFNLTGNYPDESGVMHETKSRDVLIRLAYLDGRFYVASDKSIISIFKDGRNYKICPLSNYPVGFGVENGNLVYQPYQTYTPVLVDKNIYLNEYLMTNNNATYNNYADVVYDGVINTKDFAANQHNDYIF